MSTKDIAKHLNLSITGVRNNAKSFRLKSKGFLTDIKKTINMKSKEKICGIYGIAHKYDQKVYIGSSYDCIGRINEHMYKITKHSHINPNLNNKNPANLYFVIFDTCEDKELLNLEDQYIDKYSPFILYNINFHPPLIETIPFLDKAIANKVTKNYTVNGNCWEYNGKLKRGYGQTKVYSNGKAKSLIVHRISYYEKTGEYPKLIRHTCNNKACINPAHLISGSNKENSQDYVDIINKKVENAWILHRGDREMVTKEMGWKPSKNKKYSLNIYRYIKTLDLYAKYPDIAKPIRISKAQKKRIGSRGPRRDLVLHTTVNCWTCVEEFIDMDKHMWQCDSCDRKRIATKSSMKRSKKCSVCQEVCTTQPSPFIT